MTVDIHACLEGPQGGALLILCDKPGIYAAAHCSFPVRCCSFHGVQQLQHYDSNVAGSIVQIDAICWNGCM